MAHRVSQVPAEAVIFATNERHRVSQVAGEALIFATNERHRVSQVVVEVILLAGGNAFVGEPGGAYW